jgi:N-acetylneuraminate synthase
MIPLALSLIVARFCEPGVALFRDSERERSSTTVTALKELIINKIMTHEERNRMSVYFIAEAGVNHNGSLDMALRLVDVAAEAGANAVKFQTFTADSLARREAPKAAYQKQTTGNNESQFQMLHRLELSQPDHEILIKYCIKKRIDFLSTPFDEKSLDFLTDKLHLRTIKLGSGDVTNGPLLLRAAQKNVHIILSTGMSTLGEVETALACLAFGYTEADTPPSLDALLAAYASSKGQVAVQQHVTLLHCTTEYPAPFAEVNLRAMLTMREAFNLPVGFSDHTEGIAISIAAAALGATVIEKHFTLDKTLPGPDHKASLEPHNLTELVRAVRTVETALGNGIKAPSPSEWKNREIVRKSLVAKCPIRIGESLTSEKVTCKRPGGGMSPFSFWSLLGRRALKDYAEDEALDE